MNGRPIPEAFVALGVSGEAWELWRSHRRGKLSDAAIALQTRRLAEYRAAGDAPDDVIRQSVERGWTGLFPVHRQRAAAPELRADRRANIAALTGRTPVETDHATIDGIAERLD